MRESIRFSGLAVACGLAWTVVGAAESQAVNTWSRFGDGPAGEQTGSVLLYARDVSRLLLLGGEHKAAAAVQAVDLAARQWTEFATNAPQRPIHPYYQAAYHPKGRTVYCLSNGSILYTFNTEEKTSYGQETRLRTPPNSPRSANGEPIPASRLVGVYTRHGARKGRVSLRLASGSLMNHSWAGSQRRLRCR
jgi:hypothetical protein